MMEMELIFALPGEEKRISKIVGNDKRRKCLMDLGFVEGAHVKVLSLVNGSFIVSIMGARVALDRSLVANVHVEEAEA